MLANTSRPPLYCSQTSRSATRQSLAFVGSGIVTLSAKPLQMQRRSSSTSLLLLCSQCHQHISEGNYVTHVSNCNKTRKNFDCIYCSKKNRDSHNQLSHQRICNPEYSKSYLSSKRQKAGKRKPRSRTPTISQKRSRLLTGSHYSHDGGRALCDRTERRWKSQIDKLDLFAKEQPALYSKLFDRHLRNETSKRNIRLKT